MGMSGATAPSSGGRRRRGVPRYAAMADINMTPFIDVMLVLLIIFMVAAPLLATGVPIDVPQTSAGPINVDQKPVTVAIDEKGQITLQDQPVQPEELVTKLTAMSKAGFDERVYVRGSKQVNYGRIAEVMAIITTSGFKKVALITESNKK